MRVIFRRLLYAVAALALAPPLAFSQTTQVQPSPWLQLGYTTLATTNSSSNVALPGKPSGRGFNPGTLASICNTSATIDSFVAVGADSSITATTTSTRVPAGRCVPMPASGFTYIAGITASSTATLAISTGTGSPFADAGSPGTGGSVTGCAIGGAAGIVVNDGAGNCQTDTAAQLAAGALSLGSSGTLGSITMGNATTGTVKVQPVTGALGSVTLSLPAATDQLVGRATTDTLTNKTISCSANTCTNINLTTAVTGILPIANGGTATATPSLVAGTNVTITGSWPNQTINASGGGGGGGTVTSVGLSVPAASILGITGSPVTTTGTLALSTTGTSGGVPYFSSSSVLTSSGVLGANQLVLGGGAAAAPIGLGSLGTTNSVLHGNAAGAPSFGAVSLTADVTGILGVSNGGTGLGSGTSGGIPAYTGSTTITSSGVLAANSLMVGGGAGVAPSTVTTGSGVLTALAITHDTTGGICTVGGAGCAGSGSGPGTWTGGGNSATGVNSTAAFGNGFVVTPNGASGGTATVNSTVVDVTKTANYQVAAGDMANALNLNGTLTLTLPAASSTIFAPGMSLAVTVQSGTITVTNSTGLTAGSNFPTSFAPGSSGTFVANNDGTHIDFFPGQVGVAAVSNQWVNSITASGPQLSQPAFTNLSGANSVGQIAGSPASHAVPVDVAGTATWKVVPDCQDTTGNHINYTQSTDAWSCGTSAASVTRTATIGWVAGVNPNNALVIVFPANSTLVSIVGNVETGTGSAATVSVNVAPSGTACSAGTTVHSGSFNANGTAATNQTLTLTTTAITSPARLCLQTTGTTSWTSGTGIGGLTVTYTTP